MSYLKPFKYIRILLLVYIVPLGSFAQSTLPQSYFGGLSMHTAERIGCLDSVASSFAEIQKMGINDLRIELKDTSAIQIQRLDSLLGVAAPYRFRVYIAVADTTLSNIRQAIVLKSDAKRPVIKAWIVMYTHYLPEGELQELLKEIADSFPEQSVGLSVACATDGVVSHAARWPMIDFLGVRLGYREQGWASRDRVRGAMGQVFTRLPLKLEEVYNVIELTEKPLIVDYIDYPRDRAFHYPTSPALIRENIITFVRRIQNEHPEMVRGVFLGEFVGDPSSVGRQPTETVYATDTVTIQKLVQKSMDEVQ